MKIVAPICSPSDADAAIAAGADELYVGAMFDGWAGIFGDADLLSRRQGRVAHVRHPKDLSAIARACAQAGRPVALTLNSRYSTVQEQMVLDLAARWEDMGGPTVIVADIGLLLALRQRNSRLRRHLSLLAGVFNRRTVEFFGSLGVRRVILPRDLAVSEVRVLTAAPGGVEFEMIGLYQKCPFIDGMCGFHHAVRVPAGVPAEFDVDFSGGSPVVWSHDPDYEGHGCQLRWESPGGPVRFPLADDLSNPHCAACSLADLTQAGVGFLKMAGRGYPIDIVVRGIRFLRRAIEVSQALPPSAAQRELRRLYTDTFGQTCDRGRCYYC